MQRENTSVHLPASASSRSPDSDGSTQPLSLCIAINRRDAHLQFARADHLVSCAITAARFGHADWSDEANFLSSASCDIDNERAFDFEPHLRGGVGDRFDIGLEHGTRHAAFRLHFLSVSVNRETFPNLSPRLKI